MNGSGIMRLLRTLVDDGKEWMPSLDLALACINEAQYRFLDMCLVEGDERALRPLYVISPVTTDGMQLPSPSRLHLRGCMLYLNPAMQRDEIRLYATYVPYSEFLNFKDPGSAPSQVMPQSAYYSYYNDRLYFHPSNVGVYAEIYYIKPPTLFTFGVGNTNGTFDFPPEYHAKIVAIAADLINDMDTLELRRSEMQDPSKTVSISDTAL